MQDYIIDFLIEYPIAWVAVLLLAPLAISYRYRKLKRSFNHANDAKSKSLLIVGGIAAALIIWGILRYI